MGRNNRQNKAITKMYLPRLKKYCEQLEQQLEALKSDPNTTLGQVITQARELYTQNARLSTLCASLLEREGGKVELPKESMTKYENKRILIKWELPEGITKAEDAATFVFTYEVQDAPQQPQSVQVGPHAHARQACTDPACELTQKGVGHSHDPEPEAPAPAPDAEAHVKLTAEDGTVVEGDASITLGDDNKADFEFTEPPTITLPAGTTIDDAALAALAEKEGLVLVVEKDGELPVSNAMQGVDCPLCEDGTEHTHAAVGN